MDSLLDDIDERRELFGEILLTDTCYLIKRTMVDDGGGTEIETFAYEGVNFACRLQQIQRRPEEVVIAQAATYTVTDLVLIYLPDGPPARLNKVDRVQVGSSVYSLRDIYDNIPDQMTCRAYVGLLPDQATYDLT